MSAAKLCLLCRASWGSLYRKTWYLPRMMRDPVCSTVDAVTGFPLTKHCAPDAGIRCTLPSSFKNVQCSSRIDCPLNRISGRRFASGRPTLQTRPYIFYSLQYYMWCFCFCQQNLRLPFTAKHLLTWLCHLSSSKANIRTSTDPRSNWRDVAAKNK